MRPDKEEKSAKIYDFSYLKNLSYLNMVGTVHKWFLSDIPEDIRKYLLAWAEPHNSDEIKIVVWYKNVKDNIDISSCFSFKEMSKIHFKELINSIAEDIQERVKKELG